LYYEQATAVFSTGLLGATLLALPFRAQIRHVIAVASGREKSVAGRLRQYGTAARGRLAPAFRRAGVGYPPRTLVLVGLKQEKLLQVYAAGPDGKQAFIRTYPILGTSGTFGPKLREGDGQIPEGLYRIDWLNPNSAYHLSLHIDYPNAFDREMGKREGRTSLGGDIMIHGGDASIGCLAMGDEAAEDLFVLVADTGLSNIRLILSPLDFRTRKTRTPVAVDPPWVGTLHAQIETELKRLPPPPGK
jgi:hypothetical protein